MERKRKPSLSRQAEDGCIGFRNRFHLKNIKIIGEATSAVEEAAATFTDELKKKLSRRENTILGKF